MTELTPMQVISTYESIAGITGRMRAAAQAANWEQLTALERDCAAQVALLRDTPAPAALSRPQQRRKFDLLRQILADDAAIRRQTEPWIDELQSFIDSAGKARRVQRAYGLGPDREPGAR